ncbi:MAG: exodeoxyribonuclease VII large subunit [Cyclobacteriaceae bacterium]|nr:exodeoxyribonuclease VII large subunit [Cyclobacteriaceae bacterium]
MIDNYQPQYTLLDFNRIIRDTLETYMDPDYWVVAEIGELKVNQRGHCYISLVEKSNEKILAQARATIWANNYTTISRWFEEATGERLRQGIKILSRIRVNFHEVYGLSLNIISIDPSFTLGERAVKRQETINMLVSEGLMDLNKQLVMASVPFRLAVISSPTAAGYEDFCHQLDNNAYQYHFNITLFKALLQGDGAITSITKALSQIEEEKDRYDVVVIIRGGGSQLDLDCFDSRELTRVVACCPLPVLAGIGHERDETVTDMVAFKSLKTPTAVAEFLISCLLSYEQRLVNAMDNIRRMIQNITQLQEQRLSNKAAKLSHLARSVTDRALHHTDKLKQQLSFAAQKATEKAHNNLIILEKRIEQNDPEKILKRGYSLTAFDNKPLLNARQLKAGDQITTYLSQGVITSKIETTDQSKTYRNGKKL